MSYPSHPGRALLDPPGPGFGDPPGLPHAGQAQAEDGIDLLGLLAVFLAEWRWLAVTFLLLTAFGLFRIFSLQSLYVADATFLPQVGNAQSDSLSALLGPRSSGSLYIGLLRSRSVADDVIARLHLLQAFGLSSQEKARKVLAGQSSFDLGADGIITISIRDGDARRAAAIADTYLDSLQHLDETMSAQQSRQTQAFFQAQLEQERAELATAENNLESTQKKTGLIAPDTQTQIGLNAIAGVRNQITALQVQLASLLQSETEQNPQVQRLRSQIAQLESQERTLEGGPGSSASPVGAAPPASQLPGTNLDVARAQREVRFHDALVNSLSSEYGNAHLSQDLSRPAFQVIDRAVVPEQKSWPPRKLFLLATLGLALLGGIVVVTLRLVARRILRDPANAESLRAIRRALSLR